MGECGRIRHQKAAWRARIRADRATRGLFDVGDAVAARCLALVEAAGAHTVGVYVSYGTEVPTGPLIEALAGRRILLPRPGASAREIGWGPLEPGGDPRERARHGPRAATSPDVVAAMGVCILPALAVDTRGVRLGQGGGWYDRALAALPHARAVALTWDCDVVDQLPADSHDVPVDVIVTPTRTIRIPTAP